MNQEHVQWCRLLPIVFKNTNYMLHGKCPTGDNVAGIPLQRLTQRITLLIIVIIKTRLLNLKVADVISGVCSELHTVHPQQRLRLHFQSWMLPTQPEAMSARTGWAGFLDSLVSFRGLLLL